MDFSNPKIHTDWAKIPDSPSAQDYGRTHAVHVLKSRNIFLFHQACNSFVEYDPDGNMYMVGWIIGGRINKVEFET